MDGRYRQNVGRNTFMESTAADGDRLPFDDTRVAAVRTLKAGNHARYTVLSSISVKGLPV